VRAVSYTTVYFHLGSALVAATKIACTQPTAIFYERPRARTSLLAQALIQLRHGLQGYDIGVCFVASKTKRKEKKEVLGTSNNESKVTERKILLPLRRPEGTFTNVFYIFQNA